ncbi:hypothetical protein [Spiroplasma endosymbiont of Diplazon laetatorius]|uniref:hypothetical protein n=1 Tax=Spiroplasma endosymbiont of Diplazon laetatorius TaxID=3066322 RepID=UPI0030D474DE
MKNSNLILFNKYYKKLKKEAIFKQWIKTILKFMVFTQPSLINIPNIVLRPQAKELAKNHLLKIDYSSISNFKDIIKHVNQFINELNKKMEV